MVPKLQQQVLSPYVPHLITHSYNDSSQDIKDYIQNRFANRVNGTVIIEMVSTIYNINIAQYTLDRVRTLYTDKILQEYGLNPGSFSCDKLLQFFRANKDISFLSVTHTENSGL